MQASRPQQNQKSGEKKNQLNLITEINETLKEENDMDSQHFFFVNGYIRHIKNDDKLFYMACNNDQCRKKVTENQVGYRCESCDKTYSVGNPTYMITAKISDFTDSIYVNFARDQGKAIMGDMTAADFKKMRDDEPEEKVQAFFDSLMFRPYNMMVKGKHEFFNNENRMRYFAVKVLPHSLQSENKALLRRLEIYGGMKEGEKKRGGQEYGYVEQQMDGGSFF
jgi:hypothetical protein